MMTRHTRLEVTSGQAKLVNRLPGPQILSLDIVLPLRDRAGLESFLQEVYDPTSPIYRQFLTVPEFTERFGPTQADYDAVVEFAKASGFKVVGGSRDGMDAQVEGSVTVIEAAFNVTMGVYQHPTEDRTFYAPDREPTVALGFPLWHISGLDNFSTPHPALVQRPLGAKPAATTGSGPGSSFLGSDMRAAYYGGTLTGTGQSVGIFEFYGVDLADVNTYFKNIGQTNKVPITLISVAGASTSCVYSGAKPCDDSEPTIDITQAVSMAPGLSGLYVFVGKSDTAILSAMTTHSPLSAQLSCSWGWTPADPTTDDPYFQKMASQGQNFFVATGDSGAWTPANFPYPAEDPNVVAVGGTSLTTVGAGGPWASETAWADGGGGISPNDLAIPSWQKITGVITVSNDGSTAFRNGPDVSANADFTYYVCADQSACTENLDGGTSFAAPLWAGYLALVNQQSKLNGHAVLGFLNPLIYPLGVGAGYDTYFHDITSGSNGYPAVTGYDLATGWGSPNGAGLLDVLSKTPSAPNFSIYASPNAVSVEQGNSGTSTITTTLSGGFNAAITLSATGEPSGVTVSFPVSTPPNTILPPGSGSVTMTMAVASSTATGTYTITVTGTGDGVTQTAKVTLTVTPGPSFAISSAPTSVTVAQGYNGTSTITTTVSLGFDSAVALSATGQPSTVTVGFSPASIAAPGSGSSTMTMAVGASTAIGKYTITVTGTGGGVTQTTNVTLNVTIPPNFTISPSPSSVSAKQGYSGTTTITTAVSGGFDSAVALSATGQPSGVTVYFSPTSIAAPGSGSSVMTMTVAASTPTGPYPITVTGTGGGITHSTTVTLTVTGVGFTLSPSPASISVAQGSNGTSKITSTVMGGFDSAITLSASGLPTGVTAAFNPTSITGAGSSTLTLTVALSTVTGPYPITVSGVSGSITETTTVSLTVTTVGSASSDFSISVVPSSLTLGWLNSSNTTITITPSGGFSSAVALSASGVPSGVVLTLTPTSVAGGSGTSTMNISVREGATTGTQTITITGTGGGKTHTTTVALTIDI